jgi:hypothetical protein
MNPRQIVSAYYSRPEVQEVLVESGKGREVAGVYQTGSFAQRPGVVIYPKDIPALVRTGVVEFHCSLERWSQPMSLRQDNAEILRTGWDLVFDIDCELFEHGKIAAAVFAWALEKHGLKGISVKFTGGTGFHIGIPWESMPKEIDSKPTSKQYPNLARGVIAYLKDYCYERLERELLKKYSVDELSLQVNKPAGKIMTEEGIDPYEVVGIDTVLVSPRHLFRMPYSLNRKTMLVSLPIKPVAIEGFHREEARPDKVKVHEKFLAPGVGEEASLLFVQSIDWNLMHMKERRESGRAEFAITDAVPEQLFPPCIRNIGAGLADGRKRSLFTMINFLRSLGWKWDDAERYIIEWNLRNRPPLPDNYVRSQIRWHRARKGSILPPNCETPGRYMETGVCTPDGTCGGDLKTIKNPVNYSKKLYFRERPKKEKQDEDRPKKRKKKNPMEYPTAKA